MNRRKFLFAGAALVPVLRAQTAASKLEVQVDYTGAGSVDDTHKIYVVLWESPDFTKGDPGGPPLAVQAVASKSGTAKFDELQKSPVYISMVFDPSGKWDAASAPPSGSSVGLYAKEPGTPAPVTLEPGKTAKVTAPFDDSQKIP